MSADVAFESWDDSDDDSSEIATEVLPKVAKKRVLSSSSRTDSNSAISSSVPPLKKKRGRGKGAGVLRPQLKEPELDKMVELLDEHKYMEAKNSDACMLQIATKMAKLDYVWVPNEGPNGLKKRLFGRVKRDQKICILAYREWHESDVGDGDGDENAAIGSAVVSEDSSVVLANEKPAFIQWFEKQRKPLDYLMKLAKLMQSHGQLEEALLIELSGVKKKAKSVPSEAQLRRDKMAEARAKSAASLTFDKKEYSAERRSHKTGKQKPKKDEEKADECIAGYFTTHSSVKIGEILAQFDPIWHWMKQQPNNGLTTVEVSGLDQVLISGKLTGPQCTVLTRVSTGKSVPMDATTSAFVCDIIKGAFRNKVFKAPIASLLLPRI